MLDSSLDAIIMVDEHGAIVEFNPAAERTFGRSRSDVLGEQMAELLIPPALREAHHRGFAHFLATGEGPVLGKRLELSALRADGSAGGLQVEDELDPLPEQRAQHRRQLLHHRAEIDHARMHDLLAAEGEQLPRQRRRQGGRCPDLVDATAQLILAGSDLGARELAVARDRLQDVVELVRDAAGEAPDRLHPLRVAELLIELALLAEVA